MEKEKELEYTKDDLLNYIKLGKKIDNVIAKHNIIEDLKMGVNRFLDCSQYLSDIEKQYNKSRKLINKYAKEYKKEKDIKKFFKDFDKKINNAVKCRFWSIFDLMGIVEGIFCDDNNIELFKKELPSYEEWYQFEPKDMIFVNTFANSMKQYKRDRITSENIFYELDYAMKEYLNCIQDGYDYREQYDDGDGFVNIISKDDKEEDDE